MANPGFDSSITGLYNNLMRFTQRLTQVLVGLLVAVGLGHSELIINGDFSQPLEIGWQKDTLNIAGWYYFEWSDTVGSPGGYAAKVFKELAHHAALVQTVNVPGPDLRFACDARVWVVEGSLTCWPVAAIIIRYLDGTGTELGNTKFYCHDQFCEWVGSDTAHLIDISSQTGWQHYELGIRQELENNLPGVMPAAVRQIRIELYAFDSGT